MPRIKVNDLKNVNLSEEDLKKVTGGAFASYHTGGANFVFADGSVRSVSSDSTQVTDTWDWQKV